MNSTPDLFAGKTSQDVSLSQTTPLAASSPHLLDLIPPSYTLTQNISKPGGVMVKANSNATDFPSGHARVWLLDPNAPSPGAFSTVNTSEYPNDASVCTLSQVLIREQDPWARKNFKTAKEFWAWLQRYFLSPKCCAGILARAEKRGKKLPTLLELALRGSGWRTDIERMTFIPDVAKPLGAHALSKGRGTDLDNTTYIPEVGRALKASSGGVDREDGHTLIPTHIVSPALQHRGDKGADSDCIQAHVIVPPLTCRPYSDNDGQEGKLIAFDRTAAETTGEIASTLRACNAKTKGVNNGKADTQCVAFRAAGQDGFTPSEVSPPLASTDGGGAGVPTAFFIHSNNSEAMKKEGSGNAAGVASIARALDTNGGFANGQGGNVVASSSMGVRRLTPVECERLQGFPDDWTLTGSKENGQDVKQKDSPRYRQCGNAVTANVAQWIGARIKRFGYHYE
jgi:hypothetical protein